MTKQEKEVQQAHLDEEKKVIRLLKKVYERAAKDCGDKIAELNAREDMQNLQSVIYQKQYQQALKNQIDGILATLQTDEFGSIAEYLTASYENGYVGAMYTLKSQGIPIISPIDQSKVVKAVETDSAISQGLYKRLGEDVSYLKKSIRAELSRGTANGSSWLEIASHIANGMNSPFKKAYSRAATIARTEGHRIQQESQLDALYTARDTGADLVKQWDAALDARTRPDHRAADGQIREIDEYFNVGGEKMKAPGVGGSAKQVCNCRCCLKHRARWALDEGELEKLKKRAEYFGLDKTKDFEEFKEKYLKAAESGDTIKSAHKTVDRPIIGQEEIIEQAKSLGDKLVYQYDNGEPVGNYLNQQLGYDGLPRVVSTAEFDTLSKKTQVLYRGVTDYKDISAQEMVEQFKNGSFYSGRGIYGNGTYTDIDKSVAMYYAYDSGDNGQIMEMVLPMMQKRFPIRIYSMNGKSWVCTKLGMIKKKIIRSLLAMWGIMLQSRDMTQSLWTAGRIKPMLSF